MCFHYCRVKTIHIYISLEDSEADSVVFSINFELCDSCVVPESTWKCVFPERRAASFTCPTIIIIIVVISIITYSHRRSRQFYCTGAEL